MGGIAITFFHHEECKTIFGRNELWLFDVTGEREEEREIMGYFTAQQNSILGLGDVNIH